MPKTILIDGDILVYTMGYASETKVGFIDGSSSHTPDLRLAKELIVKKIESFKKLFKVKKNYEVVLSGTGNYRSSFYPQYKENRSVLTKPISYQQIREWLKSGELAGVIVIDGEEADDYLAARVTNPQHTSDIIISADKDFFTVPGSFYNISTKRLFKTTLSQSFSFLFFQALAGDRVDGYYGVSWVGAAKAQRILQAANGKSLRQAYLHCKKCVQGRARNDKEEAKKLWQQFRLCLDLAALRWYNEEGSKGIGLRRVFKHRAKVCFHYYLPYYDVSHNLKYGKPLDVTDNSNTADDGGY